MMSAVKRAVEGNFFVFCHELRKGEVVTDLRRVAAAGLGGAGRRSHRLPDDDALNATAPRRPAVLREEYTKAGCRHRQVQSGVSLFRFGHRVGGGRDFRKEIEYPSESQAENVRVNVREYWQMAVR
jgi:hypothetical protein